MAGNSWDQREETSKIDQLFNLSPRIQRMSGTRKKILEYLRSDPDTAPTLSITLLAKKIGVDPASITRFCQSLGFAGYPDFKFSLERNILSPLSEADHVLSMGSGASDVIQNMGVVFQQTIGETILLLDRQAVARAARKIEEAGTVHVYGHGGASASAVYAHSLLLQVGIPCYAFSDPSLSSVAAVQLGAGDVAVGISSSGTSRVSIDAMTIAKKQGATIVSITGFSNSHMGQIADMNISYHSRVKDDLRFMHMARMCEVAIIGILQLLILESKSHTDSERLETIRWAMKQGRYGRKKEAK